MRAVLLLATTSLLAAQEWHVAPGGADTAAGDADHPFATVQRGADAAQAGDTVLIHAGTYRESVRPPRSGTVTAPITFRAAGDGVTTISGADPLTGWQAVGGGVWQAPMAKSFFSSATPGDGVNLYDAAVHNQADQVFWDDAMLPVACWPDPPAAYDPSHPPKAQCERFISKTRSGNWTTGVVEDDDNTLPASACVGAQIVFQPGHGAWSWIVSGHVTAKSGARLTFKSRNDSGIDGQPDSYHARSRYWLFDAPGLLNAPGEWYHDKAAGTVRLIPPGGADPAGHVQAKRREYAFDLSERSHIIIAGLRLFACSITTDLASGGDNIGYDASGNVRYPWRNPAWGVSEDPFHQPAAYNDAPSTGVTLRGLVVEYPTHVTDVSGHFTNQWGQSSGLVLAGRNHRLEGCTIRWSAGNGVTVMGRDHRIVGNRIEDCTYLASGTAALGCGSTARCSSDHEIAWNTLRRTGRSGLNFGNLYRSDPQADGTWKARIHHNDISGFGIQDWDVGAMYSGGDGRFLRIDHNHLHHAHPDVDDVAGAGCFTAGGVYPDWARNLIIDHNLITDVEWGIHLQAQQAGATSANFLVHHNTVVVRGFGSPLPGYGPFALVKNNSADHAGSIYRNNLAWCANASSNYHATDITDAPPTRLVDHNLWWDHVAGSATDPRLQGGDHPLWAHLPTADSVLVIDQGAPITAVTREGWTLDLPQDTVAGTAPDLGCFEYGGTAWAAGAGARRMVLAHSLPDHLWELLAPADGVIAPPAAEGQRAFTDPADELRLTPVTLSNG